MRRAIGVLLALHLATLAACDANHPTVAARRPSAAPTSQGPTSARPGASSAPAASTAPTSLGPSAGAATSPTPGTQGPQLEVLLAPKGVAAQTLTGTITLDASYVVAAGGGNIIAAGGGNIVAAGGGNVLATTGAGIVAAGGGNIIAQGGGNFISHNGGAMTAGNGQSTIVAAGGGNIVAAGGGNAVVRSYRLTAASAPPAPPPPGTALPAAGMEISLIDLNSGDPVPVGVDSQGKPAYTVFSNGAGKYVLYPPKTFKGHDIQGKTMLVARLTHSSDYRTSYNVAEAAAPGGKADVDEASALVTRFIRLTYQQFCLIAMSRLLDNTPNPVPDIINRFNPCGGLAISTSLLVPIFQPALNDLSASIGKDGITRDQLAAVAQQTADEQLLGLGLDTLAVQPLPKDGNVDPKLSAVQAIHDAIAQLLVEVSQAMAKNPPAAPGQGYFQDASFVKQNAAHGLKILKASDVAEYIVVHDFGDPYLFDNSDEPEQILQAIGVDPAKASQILGLARAGSRAISNAMVGRFIAQNNDGKSLAIAEMAQEIQPPTTTASQAIPDLLPSDASYPFGDWAWPATWRGQTPACASVSPSPRASGAASSAADPAATP